MNKPASSNVMRLQTFSNKLLVIENKTSSYVLDFLDAELETDGWS